MLRKSDVVHTPDTERDYLKRKDFRRTKSGYMIKQVWSKTNQVGHINWLPPLKIPGSNLCLVKALDKLFNMRAGSFSDAAFSDETAQPYTYRCYNRFIKKCGK